MLIVYPYKTMRKISGETKGISSQVYIIFSLSCIFFLLSHIVKKGNYIYGFIPFTAFLILFFSTVYFFYFLTRAFRIQAEAHTFIQTFTYTLIPTLIWFYSNLFFYISIPPPRTVSIWGKGFSVFFITYSLSLLIWKLILVYFAVRFSSRLGLYRIVYMLFLYISVFIPLSLLLYHIGLFRIPFI